MSIANFVYTSFAYRDISCEIEISQAVNSLLSLIANGSAPIQCWHSARSRGWPFPVLKYKYIFIRIKCTEAILSNTRSRGWPFPVLKHKYIFIRIKCTEAILSNSTRKLLRFETTKMLIAVYKNKNFLTHKRGFCATEKCNGAATI